jgi:RNA polymerase sigma-70 factor (ECF subfamily)
MTLSPRNRNVIDDFQRGHYAIVKELYDEYYASLVDFSVQLIKSSPEAHHIAQETFVKLFQMRDRFSKLPDIKAFLYITVRNICFAYIKSENANVPDSEVAWLQQNIQATLRYDDGAEREEALYKMTAVVKELPQPEQTVFRTLFYDRLNIPAAADRLKLTPVAVTQLRISAFRTLREKLVTANIFSVPLFIYFVAVFCGEQNNLN